MKSSIFLFVTLFLAITAFTQIPGERGTKISADFVLGGIDTLESEILQEKRIINIYLPENYSPDSSITYPVIYLLDGGATEDFIHVAGLVRYFTTPWVNRFPKSIVVGIENVNRRRDFTFAVPNLDFVTKIGFDKKDFEYHGGSGKFISFIENELQPFMQKNYKTNSSRTIIGESLGGLLASEILIRKPSLFDTYIIISPSLWWGSESLLTASTELSKETFKNKLKIYIGAANKKEDLIMYNDAYNLAQKLKGYNRKNIAVHFDYLEKEKHATIIHQAIYNAFRVLYPQAH